MKKLTTLLAAFLLAGPLLAADKPLVIEAGQTKQLPAATSLQLSAPTTANASVNLPHGTAPTSPTNGDCWTTTTGLSCRINGATVGPYAAAPTGAALTKTDDTNVTITLGGSPTTALLSATSITAGWTGTLGVTRGGTGGGAASGTLLDNITGFASTGQIVRTGAGAYSFRTLTGPAAGLTVTNGSGVSGNPTLALANDLAAVEGLAANGLAARTATDTWAARTLTAGSAKLAVTNGDGVAGNPTVDLGAVALSDLSTTAFTSTTSTPVAQTGTLGANTATIHYIRSNKLVIGWVNCPLVNVGTGSGYVDIPMPVTPLNPGTGSFPGVGNGKETGSTGKMLGGAIVAATSALRVSFYDGTTPIGTGSNILTLTFIYEAA